MINDLISRLPENPGVYIFKDAKKKILYVGKAVNLKSRVGSYFQRTDLLTPKTRALVEKIVDIEHINVENEIEALLLESDLIKRYKPPYNISLKDDKFYKFIKIDSDKLTITDTHDKNAEKEIKPVLKVGTSRKEAELKDKGKSFGPFPEASSVNIILKTLRRIFPYRDCSNSKFARYQKAKRPCLYGQINLCPAPCQNFEGYETNQANIHKVLEYLKGDRKKLFNELEKEMKIASKKHDFETAAILRDQIQSYKYLTQHKRRTAEYIKQPNLVEDVSAESVIELVKVLKKETTFEFENYNEDDVENFRIEIFDISNFQGKNAVGSMVVLTGGIPDKGQYRKFKIQTKETPDDFAMMQEMLARRFREINIKKWGLPDLIVIDGGKGQLSSALETLSEIKLQKQIPTIGLAKRFEEIVYFEPKTKTYQTLLLPSNNSAINLLKKGRDEAHRFGITYYRNLHRKKIFEKK